MYEDDYDGYFDISLLREKLLGDTDELMERVEVHGLSKDIYREGQLLHPNMFGNVDVRRLTMLPSSAGVDVAVESYIGGLLPFVSVRENSGIITIDGFNSRRLIKAVTNHWRTSRIASSMFTRLTMRSMSFYSFFAVEVLYIISELLINDKHHGKLYRDIKRLLLSETWLARTITDIKAPLNLSKLNEMNVSLLSSQQTFLETYRDKVAAYGLKGYLLAAPPGTGKTIAGYALSVTLETDCTIIICPNNSVEEVWVSTLLSRFKSPQTYWASNMRTLPTGDERFIICHYEAMPKLSGIISKLSKKKVNVWLDESHNLNEMSSARTNNFIEMVHAVNSISTVWASGTPLKAMGKEVVPLLRTIDPLFAKHVELRFLKIFGASTLVAADIVSHRLGNVMYSIPKGDVVANEVEVFDHPIEIPSPEVFTLDSIRADTKAYVNERINYYREHMPEYVKTYSDICDAHREMLKDPVKISEYSAYRIATNELHKNFNPFADREKVIRCKQYETQHIVPHLSGAEKEAFRKSASVYKYVSLTIRGEALGRVLTRRRIDCFIAMVEHAKLPEIITSAVKKTLIFTSYVEVAEAIAKHLKKKGFHPLMVHGEHNKNLTAIMGKFKSDPTANPLIATYDSLSTAVPVIEASTCVLFNAPFRDYIRKQATSRVDRLGQDSPVTIVNITLDTGEIANISTRSSEIMEWSKEMVDALLGLGGDIEE